jgi:SagB-type dehydrogenase family enzyme
MTAGRGRLRAAPSGGALYPTEVYVAVRDGGCDAVPPGLFHYNPVRGDLALIAADVTERLASATPYPDAVATAGATLVFTMILERTRFKYGERGYRFALLEIGHMAQNSLLAATALGLAGVPLGGFYDDEANEVLGVDGVTETIVYLVAVGRRSRDPDEAERAMEQALLKAVSESSSSAR